MPDGAYELDFVFDPDRQLNESDEMNNFGSTVRLSIQGVQMTVIPEVNP